MHVEVADLRQYMANGGHGKGLAGSTPNVKMGLRPDTASVTIPTQLMVGVTAARTSWEEASR